MDKNVYLNRHKLLISKYEKLLSPFGQKVMTSLLSIKMDKEMRASKYINQPARNKNKKVIIFNDTDNHIDNTNNLPVSENVMGSQITNSENKNNDQPSISTSVDLLKSLPNINLDDNFKDVGVMISNDNFEWSPELTYNMLSKKITLKDVTQEPKKVLSWNDFFEAEIFEDDDDSEESIGTKKEFVHGTGTKNINQQIPIDVLNMDEDVREVVDNCDKSKDVNRKRKPSLKSRVSKKLKIFEPNKQSFRKERYTKTVKNWLDNIDPANIVAEDVLEEHQSDTVPNLNFYNRTRNENTVSNKTKKQKRTIQAQLANKGGVMKFCKPNTDINNIITESDCFDKENNNSKDNNIKNVDKKPLNKLREKKNSKFVAPVKSQIPVRDVTYAVNIVDDNNFELIKRDLEGIANGEIVAILVYSNGFCQLNSQHTDDSCVPEGVMIQFSDTYFYFKKNMNCLDDCLNSIMKTNSLIGYDVKATLIFLVRHFGITLNNFNIFDMKIGANLLNPDKTPGSFTDLQKFLNCTPSYTIATNCGLQKTCWYMTALSECGDRLKAGLEEHGLWKVFSDIEMRIVPIISDMELLGVKIDTDKLKSMESKLLTRMKEIEAQCHAAAGRPFQILSTLQVRSLLYEELRLDAKCNVKIRETVTTGAKSTCEAMLRSLQEVHPLPRLILQYRHLHKAHATFLSGIAHHVRDGVVYPTWEQTAAATGRIACNNPNLQAIPKTPFTLTLFPDHCDVTSAEKPTLNFRSIYTAREGRCLLAADFQHMECRVFALAAADEGLLSALSLTCGTSQTSGTARDLFVELAANWLKKPESEVSSEDRDKTKRLLYASLYGAGTRKLMEILNLGYDQVLSIMTSFNRTYPCLRTFTQSVIEKCTRAGGRVATGSGRARILPTASESSDDGARAQRQAVNFVIQGTAADICKTAMAMCWEQVRNAHPPINCRLLLQIHDELLWEVAEEDLDTAAGIIKEAMESSGAACGLPRSLPLPVALSYGPSWGQLESYNVV